MTSLDQAGASDQRGGSEPRHQLALGGHGVSSKITASHLGRTAFIYVRQSTLRQVLSPPCQTGCCRLFFRVFA